MISQETIQQVKDKVDIIAEIGARIKLKKQGVNHTGLCPFHNEKTPSFTVSKAKGIFKCFGCGRSGDAIQFITDYDKKTLPETIRELCERYNIEYVEAGRKREYIKPLPRLEKLDSKKLYWFEQERNISNDTLLRAKVTESTEYMPQLEKEVPVICFPYYRGEELVNIKFRGPKKSFKLSKDAELIFFNLNAIDGQKEAVIVEGEIDTLTMIECGVYNVIGVPNGTPPVGSKMNLEYLDNCWKEINKLESVIIAVDNDEVGKYLKEELGRRIGKEKCKVVVYPDGCKDPNEILTRHGKESVRSLIESARPWPMEGIVPMEDIYDEVMNYFENGYPPGTPAGIEGFDNLLTFFPGHLTMVTGIPGHGKDEFTNWVMASLTKNRGWKWGVFNFEEPAAIHTTKLMEKLTDKAFAFRKDPSHRMSQMERDHALGIIDAHFRFVDVSKIEVTIQGIISKAIELVKSCGIDGIIINPWNYLEHKRNDGKSETEYVSEVLTQLVNFLWQYGVHCLLVAHPSKMNKDKQTKVYEVPTLYSISGSAHFYNKTHNGFCVYKTQEGITEIHVQKVKWYWLGKTGMERFYFNVNTRQYSLLEPDKTQTEIPHNFKPLNSYYEPKSKDDETYQDTMPF